MTDKTIIKDGWEYVCEITRLVEPRPAPFAQTPDSPGWSEPGDEGEMEFQVNTINNDGGDYDDLLTKEQLEQELREALDEY